MASTGGRGEFQRPTARERPERMGGRVGAARELARLLDSAFRVPGTGFRFGLDPILGLIPGLGDAIGGVFAAYLLWLAARAGAPGPVLVRMLLNVGGDALLGAVPFVGDLLDAGWKANRRNLALLETYIERPQRATSSSWVVLIVVLALLAVALVGSVVLAVAAVRAAIGWVT